MDNAERQKRYRDKKRNAPVTENVTRVTPDSNVTHYATRTNPDTLNYGEPMTAYQLKQAELKANRVPIPGDYDYKGVCEQQDGEWKVRAA